MSEAVPLTPGHYDVNLDGEAGVCKGAGGPRKPVQCWGPQASTYVAQVLAGRHVTIVADPTQSHRDRYHQLPRYVRLAAPSSSTVQWR